MTEFNRNFQLDLKDLRIIEEALHSRVQELASQMEFCIDGNVPKLGGVNLDALKKNLGDIYEVLGHLHNQKIWYEPEDFVPRG